MGTSPKETHWNSDYVYVRGLSDIDEFEQSDNDGLEFVNLFILYCYVHKY